MWSVDAMMTLTDLFAANQWMVVLWHKAQEDAKIIPIINEEIELRKERKE